MLKKILIVDDDERMAALVAQKLQGKADCVLAYSGEDALLTFEHHLRERAPFDAVFMDIEMPGMDGHEVVQKMRRIENQYNVDPLLGFKLVMLTAHKDVKNVSKSFFKGNAEAYIYKKNLSETFYQELEKINLI